MDVPSPGWSRSASLSLPRLALSALVVVLLAIFLIETVHETEKLYPALEFDYQARDFPAMPISDFAMFYTGADNARNLDPELYDINHMVRTILLTRGADPETLPLEIETGTGWEQWQRYYNPPFYLLFFAPLTVFELHTAFLISIGLNLAALAGMTVLMGVIMRWRQPQTLLMAVALFAYTPIYFTIQHAQPTPLISCLIMGGFLALQAGRVWIAGGLLALIAMKPHLALASGGLLRTKPRLLLPMLVFGTLLVFGPFLLLGPGSLVDYVQAVLGRGGGDLNDPAYAAALLNWTGFFSALFGSPQPALWAIASLATIGTMAVVLRRSEPYLVLPAAILTTILVIPHAHPQEWVLVFPALAILLSHDWPARTVLAIGSTALAIFAAANTWTTANQLVLQNETAIYWIAPATFALLLLIAGLSLRQQPETRSRAIRRGRAVAAGG